MRMCNVKKSWTQNASSNMILVCLKILLFKIRQELLIHDIKITRAQATKEKKDKLDFTEIKNFCFLKNTTEKVKKQAQNERKYLQIRYVIKDLYPIYKELITQQ